MQLNIKGIAKTSNSNIIISPYVEIQCQQTMDYTFSRSVSRFGGHPVEWSDKIVLER